MGQPRPPFRLFSVFSNKHQYNLYNKPTRIWCRDSNPQPLDFESSPITTRPGLPIVVVQKISVSISKIFSGPKISMVAEQR